LADKWGRDGSTLSLRLLILVAQSPSKILLLHAGGLGDCVLALHFIAALRQSWQYPPVTVAARSSIIHWAKRHGLIDEARSIEAIGTHYLYQSFGELPEQIVQFLCGFDRVVSFLGGREETVSKRLAEVAPCEVYAIDPRPKQDHSIHIVRQWADQLRGYEVAVDLPSAIQLDLGDRRMLRIRLSSRIDENTAKIVLCHPGSGGLSKCCPLEALEALVTETRRQGLFPAWMIGPDEMERFGPEYARRLERTAPVLSESIELAADLVAGADVFIGNDAGMTHVAALAGVFTMALFGPTDPAVWRPLGPNVHVCNLPSPLHLIEEWASTIVSLVNASVDNRSPVSAPCCS